MSENISKFWKWSNFWNGVPKFESVPILHQFVTLILKNHYPPNSWNSQTSSLWSLFHLRMKNLTHSTFSKVENGFKWPWNFAKYYLSIIFFFSEGGIVRKPWVISLRSQIGTVWRHLVKCHHPEFQLCARTLYIPQSLMSCFEGILQNRVHDIFTVVITEWSSHFTFFFRKFYYVLSILYVYRNIKNANTL